LTDNPQGELQQLSQQERRRNIIQAIELSHDMLKLAQIKNWEQVALIEQQQSGLLQLGFKQPIPLEMHKFSTQSITEIQRLNGQIAELIETTKDGIQVELGNLQRGKKATALYSESGPQR